MRVPEAWLGEPTFVETRTQVRRSTLSRMRPDPLPFVFSGETRVLGVTDSR